MRDIGWTGLAAITTACLAVASYPLQAAPATQSAQSQPSHASPRFTLDPSDYPPDVSDEEQYGQYLASELRKSTTQEMHTREPTSQNLQRCLDAATFALTRAAEPDLTRVWLWQEAKVNPRLARQAWSVARQALSDAETLLRTQKQASAVDAHADGIQVLTALLAMERVLLTTSDSAEALRAADQADAATAKVPPGAEATWQLLIAGCLHNASHREDAQLRLQLLLRRHKDSPQALAAVMLQARMLAETGNFAGAIGLVSECLQALPAVAGQQASAPASQSAPPKPDAQVARTSLSLLKVKILDDWADKVSGSTNELDRPSAVNLRKQASTWRQEAEASGTRLLRLLPMLKGLERPCE
jgi:hypothetical protein